MSRILLTPAVAMLLLTMTITLAPAQNSSAQRVTKRIPYPTFELEVLVDGKLEAARQFDPVTYL